jgi:ubiquinone/menaquinone biosynthesis C-methylase UbiE
MRSLLHLLLPIVLILYAAVILAFIVMRKTKAGQKRPFKVRWGIPLALFLLLAIGALMLLWLLTDHAALRTLQDAAGFAILGIPIFLLLSFYYDPETIIKVTEWFAFVSLWLENLLLPKKIRKEMLSVFENLEEKHILEYGAGVGTLTMHLAEKVGPRGKVTATDLSAKNLKILERRLRKKEIVHVSTVHDPHQVNRVHPEITEVDFVFSVGQLSYIQDMQKVLKDISKILPEGGKVCFVEYVDYFRFLPNPKWLDSDATLKELFKEAGFSVHVVKIHGIFWNYLFIYGEKTTRASLETPYI